ncbi:protein maelstrom homolog [Eublepharis macularius]|uniref:Protein maelstrom homolog n=1 Tax=Eublepharis macularius TaxID=481883 RepID=A0AA97J341_EUBMA|nr:protein maelstrom homolog [Eublepharis macularius]
MPNRKSGRNAYYFFVLEKLPELKRRGLNVTSVVDAIPHCSDGWAMLTEEQKEKYADKARLWKAKKSEMETKSPTQVPPGPPRLPVQSWTVPIESLTNTSRKCDQVVLKNAFYVLNIFSHGELPPHCVQRFLPCEIGCVKYSLKDGIIADFHHFIDTGAVPRGFRYHCQAAGDATHRIPISGFELTSASHSVVFRDLCMFIKPHKNNPPLVYCKSDDWFRVNWCLKHMAEEAGTINQLKLLNVEDLVVELYQQKFQKEPSKTWVCNTLDASMWDYSSNIRCKWHEDNDILFCALASCKKIAYCISHFLANLYGIPVTTSHLPVHDKDSQSTVNPKMVVLDAGRFQRARAQCGGNDGHFTSLYQDTNAIPYAGKNPSGVKTESETSAGHGRGIIRFLETISKQSGNWKLASASCPK